MSKKTKSEEETNPERILKLKNCTDFLLAGGYFRCRLSTLSPFDKVVGGIVWSITMSGVSVGVDILFQENSTIGQRIKLCENLVKALIAMKCPEHIQEHQIQGLDYDHLFPVIQWLVRQVLEHRALTGDTGRMMSENQFEKNNYQLPEDKAPEEAKSFVATLTKSYRPSRQFRKRENAAFETPAARTEATLLEYGEKLYGTVVMDEEKEEQKRQKAAARGKAPTVAGAKGGVVGKLAGAQQGAEEDAVKAEEERKKALEQEKKRLDDLQNQLSEDGAAVQISGQKVGTIVQLGADEIRRAAEEYEEQMKNVGAEGGSAESSQKSAEQAYQRQLEALSRNLKKAEALVAQKTPAFEALEQRLTELQTDQAKKQKLKDRIVVETEKLDEQEAGAKNKGLLAQLKRLVQLNESLKAQENQFKENCKQQRADLMRMLAELESAESDEDTKRMLQVEALYEADAAKLQKIRQALAEKNQDISRVTRLIDEIPTRAELLQFERRFVELYELVQDKLVETRKYYNLYNTLDETHRYMQNEVNLLNSIIDGFPKAMKTKAGQDQFLASFSGILTNVEASKSQATKEAQTEQAAKEVLVQKQAKLLERQRRYFKLVKEFQEECHKNEQLTEKLERLKEESS